MNIKEERTFFNIKGQNNPLRKWDDLSTKEKKDFINNLLTTHSAGVSTVPPFGKIFWSDDVGMSYEDFRKLALGARGLDPNSEAMQAIGMVYDTKAMEKRSSDNPVGKAIDSADASAAKDIDAYLKSQAEKDQLALADPPDPGAPTSEYETYNKYLRKRMNNLLGKFLERIRTGMRRPVTPEEVRKIKDIIVKKYADFVNGATMVTDQSTGEVTVVWQTKAGKKFRSPTISVASPDYFRESKEKSQNQLILENHRKNRKVHPVAKNNWWYDA